MKTSLVIFDLDGTLLDTIGDLAVACNAVLGVRGLPQHTYEEYCHFVGNGILRLVERALPEPLRTPETIAAVRADFVKYYTEHIDAHTRPYDGIPELVGELVRRGVGLAGPDKDSESRGDSKIYFSASRGHPICRKDSGIRIQTASLPDFQGCTLSSAQAAGIGCRGWKSNSVQVLLAYILLIPGVNINCLCPKNKTYRTKQV